MQVKVNLSFNLSDLFKVLQKSRFPEHLRVSVLILKHFRHQLSGAVPQIQNAQQNSCRSL